jgi:hypothetical protein
MQFPYFSSSLIKSNGPLNLALGKLIHKLLQFGDADTTAVPVLFENLWK